MDIRYKNLKTKILNDDTINKDNHEIINKFLKYQELKLKRSNNLRELDNPTYSTLYYYLLRIKNVLKWFKGKSLYKITKKDIEKVYNDIEDGKITKKDGKPIESKTCYYDKMFKSEFFKIAGKDELAREVIKYSTNNVKEVRFINEEDFFKLVDQARNSTHRILLWLAWDIGENINALLKLKKRYFTKQLDPETNEYEYRVNLPQEILKRSRRTRSELTNYSQTVKLLDTYLESLKEDDNLFSFDYRNAKKIIDRIVTKINIKCIPEGQKVTWKDLRSGMACDLLKKGWTTDEVNARLGHKPSSDEIDKYVNFLAIDKKRPKKKFEQFKLDEVNKELELIKNQNKLVTSRYENLQDEVTTLKKLIRTVVVQMATQKPKHLSEMPEWYKKRLKKDRPEYYKKHIVDK